MPLASIVAGRSCRWRGISACRLHPLLLAGAAAGEASTHAACIHWCWCCGGLAAAVAAWSALGAGLASRLVQLRPGVPADALAAWSAIGAGLASRLVQVRPGEPVGAVGGPGLLLFWIAQLVPVLADAGRCYSSAARFPQSAKWRGLPETWSGCSGTVLWFWPRLRTSTVSTTTSTALRWTTSWSLVLSGWGPSRVCASTRRWPLA